MSEYREIHKKLRKILNQWASFMVDETSMDIKEIVARKDYLGSYLDNRIDQEPMSDLWERELLTIEPPKPRSDQTVEEYLAENADVAMFFLSNFNHIVDSVDKNIASYAMLVGNQCPKGKVQVEFVGNSPEDKISEYGWRPTESSFIELFVDGDRYRIDVGNIELSDGVTSRGIKILHPMNAEPIRASSNVITITTPRNKE